jgi:hypothetical protein
MASSPAWSQLVTDVSSIQHAARGDSSGSLGVSYSPSCHLRGLHDSPALRVGNKLRVDVERRADAGMPHHRLNIFRVRAGLDRPGCPGVRRQRQFTKPKPSLRPAGFMNRVRILLSRIGFRRTAKSWVVGKQEVRAEQRVVQEG